MCNHLNLYREKVSNTKGTRSPHTKLSNGMITHERICGRPNGDLSDEAGILQGLAFSKIRPAPCPCQVRNS